LNKNEIVKKVTEGIIECLEKGTIPWSSGYINKVGLPTSFHGKLYKGMNTWILNSAVINNNFPCNTWITFNQTRKQKGHVLKGSKATTIVFWKFLEIEKTKDDGTKYQDTIPLLKTFNVFNLAQTSLYKESDIKEKKIDVNNQLAEQIIANWTEIVPIKYGYDNFQSPYYSPNRDFINIPFGKGINWKSEEYLNKVTFHEMIHSTGHTSRLNRFDKAELNGTNADILHDRGQYSAEELVAEMGSQILADICNFKENHIENTSSYINSWIKCLKNNTDWILWASGKSEKAVDMILENTNSKLFVTEKEV